MDFEVYFKPAVFSMNQLGAHPETESYKTRLIRFCFWHGSYTITASFIFYSVVMHDLFEDFALACENFSLVIIYWFIGLGNLMLYVHRDKFRKIIHVMREDYALAMTYAEDEKKIVQKYADTGKLVVKVWILMLFGFFVMFIVMPVVMMAYFAIFGEFRYVLAAELTYPPKIQNAYENTFGLWFFNVTSVFISEVYASCVYIAVVSMGPVYMLHGCGQLEVLTKRVLQIFPEDKEISFAEREQKIKDIARKLQDIYDFMDCVKDGYRLFYELSLKGTALILPVLAFQIVDSIRKGENEIEVTIVLFVDAIAVSAFPCYYGDLIIQKSEEFRNAVYSSRWETMFDKRARGSLLLIMTRTERNVAVNSVFGSVSLDGLADVFNLAYVIFNAINTALG